MKRHVGRPLPKPAFLSVVCATRNAGQCIQGLLESYRRERTDESQLIILDSASTDETWDIVLRHSDIVDTAISEPDAGIYDAWNKGISLCKGSYISFIGADDLLACGSITKLINACREDQTNSHIVAGFNILTRQAVPTALLGSPFDRRSIHRRMPIAQVMSAHRLSWLTAAGGFDASYRSSGDYELLLRHRETLRVNVIPVVLAYMEDGGTSRTSLRPHFENYRARRSNGLPPWVCATLLAKALLSGLARKAGFRA